MIELPYSLIIEATEEPDYFGFYSPDLEGFTGIGHSVEDCLFQARWGMDEHAGGGRPLVKLQISGKIISATSARPPN